MSNYTEPVVFYCPNCGSSISMQADQGTCAYCGTAVERPAKAGRVKSSSPSWSVPASTYPTGSIPKSRRGWVHPLLALLLMAATAAGGFLAGRVIPNGASTTIIPAPMIPSAPIATVAAIVAAVNDGSLSELAAALPRDGKGSDLLVYLYHSDTSRYSVGLIDGGTHATRWQSPLLSKSAYQGVVAIGQDMLYVTDQDQLLALRLRDGTLAWQSALAVEPSPGCDNCIRLVAGHVAVLEKDSSIQVFDAQSGAATWSTRLENRGDRMPIAGDRIVTLSSRENNEGKQLNFLDASSGKAALQLEPKCPSDPQMSRDERPDASSPFLFSADGKTMYTIFGFFAQCAQAWDLATGKARWQVPLDRDLSPGSWYGNPPMLTDSALFASNGGLVWALDTATGKQRTLLSDKEYNFIPLALHKSTLIVAAAPNWDSQRQELWGVDSTTGKRAWQIKLKAHDLREEHSSGDWMWRLTPKGLVVIQVLNDEPRLVTETFDPASGASLQRAELPLPDSSPSFSEALWGDDTAYIKIGGQVYALDLATGKVDYQLS